jgi:hypothetical protein
MENGAGERLPFKEERAPRLVAECGSDLPTYCKPLGRKRTQKKWAKMLAALRRSEATEQHSSCCCTFTFNQALERAAPI